MADYGRALQLIAELRRQVDLLAEEVARLQASEQGTARSATPDIRSLYDLDKVIPPTPTEEPDSIIGGLPTTDFPECCAVGSAQGYFCTGTLIAPTIVVTAGHCEGVDRVFLGGSDVTDSAGGETIRVAEQFDHPEADLRVLVLQHPAHVAPAHVAQGLEVQGEVATLVGFGTINFAGTRGYGEKRKVDVPIVSLDCGSAGIAHESGCTPGKELVAGHRGLNLDSCRGDSGGPLYIQSSNGPYYLLGATSRGVRNAARMCGDGGIYVRVDQYLDWIEEQTGVAIPGPEL